MFKTAGVVALAFLCAGGVYVAYQQVTRKPPFCTGNETDLRWLPRVGVKSGLKLSWQCGQIDNCGVEHQIACPARED